MLISGWILSLCWGKRNRKIQENDEKSSWIIYQEAAVCWGAMLNIYYWWEPLIFTAKNLLLASPLLLLLLFHSFCVTRVIFRNYMGHSLHKPLSSIEPPFKPHLPFPTALKPHWLLSSTAILLQHCVPTPTPPHRLSVAGSTLSFRPRLRRQHHWEALWPPYL